MPNYIGTAVRHGMANTPEYYSWQNMKDRCMNKRNAQWSDYGGRGIKVCPEWVISFKAFYEHMGPRPSGYSLDRVDVNGNYEPSNCKWSSKKDQVLNTRRRDSCGVIKRGDKWRVVLVRDKKRYNIGHFASYEEGLKARREKEKELQCLEN